MTHRLFLQHYCFLRSWRPPSAAYAAPKVTDKSYGPDQTRTRNERTLSPAYGQSGPYAGRRRDQTAKSCTYQGGPKSPSGRAGRTFRQIAEHVVRRLTKSSLDHKAGAVSRRTRLIHGYRSDHLGCTHFPVGNYVPQRAALRSNRHRKAPWTCRLPSRWTTGARSRPPVRQGHGRLHVDGDCALKCFSFAGSVSSPLLTRGRSQGAAAVRERRFPLSDDRPSLQTSSHLTSATEQMSSA